MWRGITLIAVVALSSGCRGGLVGDKFTKPGLAYRVVEPKGWRSAGFDDNDLAWVSDEGHVIAINATCTGHEDPQLDVLTNHLVIGFTDREWISKKKFTLDGREAMRSLVRARLDGVPISLELVVLKKNGCVHDFTYASPTGKEAEHQTEFDSLVAGFRQERAP